MLGLALGSGARRRREGAADNRAGRDQGVARERGSAQMKVQGDGKTQSMGGWRLPEQERVPSAHLRRGRALESSEQVDIRDCGRTQQVQRQNT